MEIQSKFFGVTTIHPDTIINMIQPIYGFTQAQRYTLMSDASIGDSLVWMQSIDYQDICFILANPQAFALKTPSSLPLEVLDLFEVNSFEELDVAYIVNIKDSLEQATVNLKSPVIFNPISKKAAQIILNEDLPLRERLISSC